MLGTASSWVLNFFGVHVPWYVCAVGCLIISALVGGRSK
jgi:hypothetical protein